MTLRRFLQLDVFADRPGAGNPLAVMADADGLDTAAMQAFANWTNLSETIFLLPPGDGADYRVRIFTPRQELPFAGHPSVGAAWAAVELGLVEHRASLVQDCAAGHLPVTVDAERRISVRAPRARPLPETVPATLDAALGHAPRGLLPAGLWVNGPHWWVVELRDEAAVRALRPDLGLIRDFAGESIVGVAVFASDGTGAAPVTLRAFCPADGVDEDPVTGSANAAAAAALLDAGRLRPGDSYIASQGREVGRDGRVQVRIDADGETWIGGEVQAVIRGTVDW